MKLKRVNLLILLIMFVIFSCKKDESLTKDNLSKKELIGHWSEEDNMDTYTFFENDTFIDSVFYYDMDIESLKRNLSKILRGDYRIENDRIFFENVDLVYDTYMSDSSGFSVFEYYYPRAKFQFIDNKLNLSLGYAFTPIKNNQINSINGTWSTVMPFVAYDHKTSKCVKADLHRQIELFSDYTYQNSNKYQYIDESWSDYKSSSYSYNNNLLILEGMGQHKVSFENENMIWEEANQIYTKDAQK